MQFYNRINLVFFFLLLAYSTATNAQGRLKVAVFAPIYTDSAFAGDTYKLGSNNLPKSMTSGLDFYNGAMMAVDSLHADGKDLEVLFYDSKGKESIYTIAHKQEFKDVSLIIAAFNNRLDVKPLADIAQARKIPLISATYPNDGGTTDNPYFVMINSSLKTHVEEIYKYLQRYNSTSNIVYLRKKGQLEDLVQYYFTEAAKTTSSLPLVYQTIELTDTSRSLMYCLDSNRHNTIICGSLNENFGTKLLKMVASQRVKYDCTIMGMPTWDDWRELDNLDFSSLKITYSSPYNFVRTQPIGIRLTSLYKEKFYILPSDMFFKGFESVYHFCNLLITNPTTLIDHLSDKKFKLFNDFDIEPVRNKTNQTTEYLENKKLYFIKKPNANEH